MSQRSLKKLLPIVILVSILFATYIELKNNIQQIKTENMKYQLKETSNNVQEPNNYEKIDKTEMNNIKILKKIIREKEQKKWIGNWKSVERKDSYNNELQFYSKDNVVIKGNTIDITSRKENIDNKMYTSGLVESIDSYQYGYFEFTIEISEGKGIFPAIWFLPDNGNSLPEIDIFEMIGSEPYTFYGVIHFQNEGVQDSDEFEYQVYPKGQYIVALDWKPELLTWYIDNKEIYSTTKCVPQEHMYIIINQAIGGNWPGKPDDTIFPTHFKILDAKIESVIKKGRN